MCASAPSLLFHVFLPPFFPSSFPLLLRSILVVSKSAPLGVLMAGGGNGAAAAAASPATAAAAALTAGAEEMEMAGAEVVVVEDTTGRFAHRDDIVFLFKCAAPLLGRRPADWLTDCSWLCFD